MRDVKRTYVAPQVKVACFGTDAFLEESLPLHEEEVAPHVTDDSQVFAKPHSVWDEE